MAITKITPTNIKRANFESVTPTNQAVTFAAVAAMASTDPLYDSTNGNGAYFQANEKDQKYVILIKNANASAAKTAYIVKGDDPVFGPSNDLKIENIAAGAIVAVNVDSARYKQMTNDNGHKEEILIKADNTDIQVAVVKLP